MKPNLSSSSMSPSFPPPFELCLFVMLQAHLWGQRLLGPSEVEALEPPPGPNRDHFQLWPGEENHWGPGLPSLSRPGLDSNIKFGSQICADVWDPHGWQHVQTTDLYSNYDGYYGISMHFLFMPQQHELAYFATLFLGKWSWIWMLRRST